jgi:signal transduction histidine kinase
MRLATSILLFSSALGIKAQSNHISKVELLLDSGLFVKADSIIKTNDKISYDEFIDFGNLFYKHSQYESSIHYFSESLKIAKKNEDSVMLFQSNQELGLSFDKLGKFDKALEHFYNALYIAEIRIKDPVSLAQINLNIGSVLDAIGNSNKALDHYKTSYQLKLQLNDSMGVARLFNNIGIIHKNNKQYDSAIYYYKRAQEMKSNTSNLLMDWRLSTNIANVYKRMGESSQAKEFYVNAIEFASELDRPTILSDSYYNMAVFSFEMGDNDSSEDNFLKALAISEGINNDYELYFLHGSMSELYAAWNKPKLALEHLLKSNEFRDKLFQSEKEKTIAELQTQYETEKKQQQIVLQNAQLSEQEAELQRNQILLGAAVLALILLVALGLLQRNRLKKKQQLKLQEAELKARDAEINATISSQEKERARYARDLHDGFGQMISVLNMNLKNLEDGAKPDERHKVFENSSKVIDEMYGELKNICFDLMPQTLIKHGLESALNEFSGRINQAEKVFVELNVFGLENRLTELQEISLYRISQEWVNNILKYSDADKITLQITKDESEITLLIEDNGTGFDKSLLELGKGNGWKNLNTRAKLIKGELELETHPNQKGNVLIVNSPTIKIEKSQNELQNTVKTV